VPQERTSAGRFPQGVSGNPGGRAKGVEAQVREATKDGADILTTVLAILAEGNPTERLKAAQLLWDRGWGKPKQAIEHSGSALDLARVQVVGARLVEATEFNPRLAADIVAALGE